MSKSIISNEPSCIVCQTTENLHKHHVFYGTANRKISEREGCWVYLCARHHTGSEVGVHFNSVFDTRLKQTCQKKWEELNGSRTDFIKLFGKSYI